MKEAAELVHHRSDPPALTATIKIPGVEEVDTHLSRENVPYSFGDRDYEATGLDRVEPDLLVVYSEPNFNWFVVNKPSKYIEIKAKLPSDHE